MPNELGSYNLDMKCKILMALFFVLCMVNGASIGADKTENLVSFDFDNADIKMVIKSVGELTGTNFIYDESIVTGTVTVSCPQKIDINDVMRALESILEVKGYALIECPDFIKVVRKFTAKEKNVGVRVGKTAEDTESGDRVYTQVIRLEHADAEEVSKLLSGFVPKDGSIFASSETNTLIITDVSSNIYRLLKIIQEVDKEAPVGKKQVYVYFLKNADPEKLAEVLSGIRVEEMRKEKSKTEKEKREVKKRMQAAARVRYQRAMAGLAEQEAPTIVADSATNALVITALPGDYEVLRGVIEKLDIRRSQVLIEALIAEVSLDKLVEIGMEWANWDEAEIGRESLFGGSSFGIREGAGAGALSGITLGIIKNSNIGGIINAYKKDADFNILSSPYLYTRDNEEAEILIGENIPYVTQSRVTETDAVNPTVIKTYAYKDVGITLRITPHINPDGIVRMEIYQLIEKLVSGDISIDTPTTVKREIKNVVDVKDGSTIVIGGLIRDDKEDVAHKIPLLGDIPILGYLFRYSRQVSTKTSLLILISPHVATNFGEIEALTQKKREEGKSVINGQ